MTAVSPTVRPPAWQVGLALSLVYICWSTTYLAIQEGVRTLPPFLFGGVRVALSGAILLTILWALGKVAVPSGRALVGTALAGILMFVGGNGFICMGQKVVPSGVAAVLVATCPLFLALLEMLVPRGERLPLWSWIGLTTGLVGVGVLSVGQGVSAAGSPLGITLCLISSFTWSAGSILARHWPARLPMMQTAALQMLFGGLTMTGIGWGLGELRLIGPESITPGAVFAFCWLLVVGSLLGFVSYVWLLGNTSATLAGTYAYVNPALAILVGWALAGEAITEGTVVGLAIILCGVALVRSAQAPVPATSDPALVVRPESAPVTARSSGETNPVAARV